MTCSPCQNKQRQVYRAAMEGDAAGAVRAIGEGAVMMGKKIYGSLSWYNTQPRPPVVLPPLRRDWEPRR